MELQKTGVDLTRSGGNSKAIEFSIGNSGIIIDILRNRLYSKPIQTMIQEYISNALDANREMGLLGSDITITAPTRAFPIFKVRDRGPGLSDKRIEDIFTKYGNSTKRENNSQIGGFGIGAKSAWSYAPAFTIRSFYEGKKVTYLAHLGSSAAGVLERISEEPSDERGVEIEVSVNTDKASDIQDFHKAIARMLSFRSEDDRPKLVEVPPEYKNLYIAPAANYSKLVFDGIGGLYYTGSQYADTHHKTPIVCIDGVPYDIQENVFYRGIKGLQKYAGFFYVLHAKTGELEVAASRESIVIDEKFAAFLIKRGAELSMLFNAHVIEEFKKCKTAQGLKAKYEEPLIHALVMELPPQTITVADIPLKWKGTILSNGSRFELETSELSCLPSRVIRFGRHEDSLTEHMDPPKFIDLFDIACQGMYNSVYYHENKVYKDKTLAKILGRSKWLYLFPEKPTTKANPAFFEKVTFRTVSERMPFKHPKNAVRTRYFELNLENTTDFGFSSKDIYDTPSIKKTIKATAEAPGPDVVIEEPGKETRTIIYVDRKELGEGKEPIWPATRKLYAGNSDLVLMAEFPSTFGYDFGPIDLKDKSECAGYLIVLNETEKDVLIKRGFKLMHHSEFYKKLLRGTKAIPSNAYSILWEGIGETDPSQRLRLIPENLKIKVVNSSNGKGSLSKTALDGEYGKKWTAKIQKLIGPEDKKFKAYLENLHRFVPDFVKPILEKEGWRNEYKLKAGSPEFQEYLAYLQLGFKHRKELERLKASVTIGDIHQSIAEMKA